MNRRRFCTLGGLAVAGLAGCLNNSDESDEEERGDGNGTVSGFGNGDDDGNGESAGTGNGDNGEWGEGESGRENAAHDLFVENHTDQTESAWIRVVSEDGNVLVDGTYELPDGRAIEFSDIAAWETTYSIDISLNDADVTTLEWTTKECGPGSEAPEHGSRNAAVRYGAKDIEDGRQFDFVVDQCDAIIAGRLPSGPADGFRIDE
jgi:hypothetical protein